jgi:hypothetical protein
MNFTNFTSFKGGVLDFSHRRNNFTQYYIGKNMFIFKLNKKGII